MTPRVLTSGRSAGARPATAAGGGRRAGRRRDARCWGSARCCSASRRTARSARRSSARDADDLEVTAFLVDLAGSDVAAAARDEAARRGRRRARPDATPRMTTTTTSRLRRPRRQTARASAAGVPGRDRRAATRGGPDGRPVAGAADGGRAEAVVPDTTARLLGLGPGDEVTLGEETRPRRRRRPVTAGGRRHLPAHAPAPGWERDPLRGGLRPGLQRRARGRADLRPVRGRRRRRSCDSGSTVNALQVTAHPDARACADDSSLQAAAATARRRPALLSARVGDRARITRSRPTCPTRSRGSTPSRRAPAPPCWWCCCSARRSPSPPRSWPAGWSRSVRDDERALLVGVGLGPPPAARHRGRRGAAARARRGRVGRAAASLAPLAPDPPAATSTAAGLQQGPAITWALVLTVLGSRRPAHRDARDGHARGPDPSPTRRRAPGRRPPRPRPAPARRGGRRLVAAARAAGHGEPHRRRRPHGGARALPRGADRARRTSRAAAAGTGGRPRRRSRGLVLPLAAQQAARRPHAGHGDGPGRRRGRGRGVRAGAADHVGPLPGRPGRAPGGHRPRPHAAGPGRDPRGTPGRGRARRPAAATGGLGGHPPAAGARPLRRPQGSRPVLVAVDARQAGALLRGRLARTTTWAGIGRAWRRRTRSCGVPLPDDGAGVALRGRGPAGASAHGAGDGRGRGPDRVPQPRSPRATSPLDGAPTRCEWSAAIGEGLRSSSPCGSSSTARPAPSRVRDGHQVHGDRDHDRPRGRRGCRPDRLRSAVAGPAPAAARAPSAAPTAELHAAGGATELRTSLDVDLDYFAYTGADLLATALPVPTDVPVAVSQDLVDAVGSRGRGRARRRSSATPRCGCGGGRRARPCPRRPARSRCWPTPTRSPARSSTPGGSIPSWTGGGWPTRRATPSRPGGGWAGRPSPPATAWPPSWPTARCGWRCRPRSSSCWRWPSRCSWPPSCLVRRRGPVTARSAEVVAAAGARRCPGGTPSGCCSPSTCCSCVPLMLVGALVGAVSAVLVGPHLVRSDVGAAPCRRRVAWPWAAELALVGGLVLGVLVVTWVLAALLVRRSGPVTLRDGEP